MKNRQRNRKSILNTRVFRCAAVLFASGMLLASAGHINADKLLFLVSRDGMRINTDHQMKVFPPPKPEEEEVLLIILWPSPDQAFSFDASNPGELRIEAATAYVSPAEYADEIVWSINDIGRTQAEITPERGPVVDIVFRGLPDRNDDFGEKRVTAAVRGVSDSVTIRAFFDPRARNHPGGDREPNWAHYWRQTSGFQGEDFTYRPAPTHPVREGDLPIARYLYYDDRIELYDALFEEGCLERSDGTRATGIDAFAETLIHEGVHRRELRYWWKDYRFGPIDGRIGESYSVTDWGSLAFRTLWLQYGRIDEDYDLVPSSIEKEIDGCNPLRNRSCRSRPYCNIRDVDMNTYRISWAQWRLGTADHEDWSRDGKQWPEDR